ncbi:MAG: M23 family metallopeptidase, partial [Angelakisella sp.]
NTEIYAAQSGTVVYASNEIVWPFGKHVIIDHGDGYQTMYAHCKEVLTQKDTEVTQGEVIARMGKTGNSTGNHCHFELRLNGRVLNVEDYVMQPE